MKRAALALVALAGVAVLPTKARAEGHEARPDDPIVDTTPTVRSWNEGAPRVFVSSVVDVGYLYMRPRAALGYGLPHASWFGLEVNPLFVNTGLGAYGGLRGAFPFFDMRVGARGYYAFEHGFLTPATSYGRIDLENNNGAHAQYVTYEAELNGNVTAGPGELHGLASLSAVNGAPNGEYVFEETLRIVVKHTVWRVRGGYSFFLFPSLARISLGPAVDVLGTPGREGLTVRGGLLARVVLSRNLEVRGSFIPTILSPDRIGLVGGDFTELGLRYRWTSGS